MSSLVSPPSAQWRTWWASQWRDEQPGKRQPLSRRPDVQDASVRPVRHHHPPGIAGQAPGSLRGDAGARLDARIAPIPIFLERLRGDVHHHLVAFRPPDHGPGRRDGARGCLPGGRRGGRCIPRGRHVPVLHRAGRIRSRSRVLRRNRRFRIPRRSRKHAEPAAQGAFGHQTQRIGAAGLGGGLRIRRLPGVERVGGGGQGGAEHRAHLGLQPPADHPRAVRLGHHP